MNTKRLIGVIALGATMSFFAHVTAADLSAVTQKAGIQTIQNNQYEIDYPSWASPDLDYSKQDLSYWVHEVLPYAQDKNESAYLVYPKQGIIIPVSTLTQTDKEQIAAGNGFDHFPYLQNSALHYVGDSPSQKASNMVLAAHSSYEKADAGRYKTAFQAVVYANKGDIVRYFEKNSDTYDRYEYLIGESKEVQTTDTSIIKEVEGKTLLTTYTCYPIGTSDSRWYNRAELMSVKKGFTATKPVVAPVEQVKKAEPQPVAVQQVITKVEEKVHQAAEIKEVIAPTVQITASVYAENVAEGKKIETVGVAKEPEQIVKETIEQVMPQEQVSQDQPTIQSVQAETMQSTIVQIAPVQEVAFQSLAENTTCQVSSCTAIEQPSYNPIYGIFTTNIKKIISPFFE